MPNREVKIFQAALVEAFVQTGLEAKEEWSSFAGERKCYSPRIDVAVGPFAHHDLQCAAEYTNLTHQYQPFLEKLYDLNCETLCQYGSDHPAPELFTVMARNYNARCFLAFEIENRTSRKHLMGGAINAAALGRIGIAVGWTDQAVKAFVNLRAYLLKLAQVNKNTFDPSNLFVISKDQLQNSMAYLTARSTEQSSYHPIR